MNFLHCSKVLSSSFPQRKQPINEGYYLRLSPQPISLRSHRIRAPLTELYNVDMKFNDVMTDHHGDYILITHPVKLEKK